MFDFVSLIIILVGIVVAVIAAYATFMVKYPITTAVVKGSKTWYNYTELALGISVVLLGVVRLIMSFTK